MTAIHHLALSASDLRKSERFYDAVLETIGFSKVLSDDEICGWEKDGFELLIYAADDGLLDRKHQIYQPGFHHLAMRVASREEVRNVSLKIADGGGVILEGPKEYPDYPGNYFAIFFVDPDGLKMEVMCS